MIHGVKRMMTIAAAGVALTAAVLPPTQASLAARPPPVLPVPGDPGELQNACRFDPWLFRWSNDPHFPMMGMQSVLLDADKLPIADEAHVDWAKPLPNGPIKILYISYVNGHGMSDMAMIAQRLDCKLWTLELLDQRFQGGDRYAYGKADDPQTGWLARKALKVLENDLDVIVLAIGANNLPPDAMAKVVEKVKAGTGLIISTAAGVFTDGAASQLEGQLKELSPYLGAAAARQRKQLDNLGAATAPMPEVMGALPFAAFYPFFSYPMPVKDGWRTAVTLEGVPLAVAGQIGKGRALLLEWGACGLFPQPTEDKRLKASNRYEEYFAAVVAKAMRWCAGHEPKIMIDAAAPADAEGGKPFALRVTARNQGAAAKLNVDVIFRDFEFRTLAERQLKMEAAPGETVLEVEMPAVPAGAKFVASVIARDDKGAAVDWAMTVVRTQAPESLKAATDKEIYRHGETVRITAALSDAKAGADYTAVVKVFDATGRLLMDRDVKLDNGAFSAEFPLRKSVTPSYDVEVTALRDGRAVRLAATSFFVPQFGWTDYRNGLWPAWWTSPYQYERGHRILRDWAELDTSSAGHGGEPWINAKLGLGTLRLNDGAIYYDKVFAGDDQKTQHATTLPAAIDYARKYGAVAWNMQDERHLGGEKPFGQVALTKFRAWLKQRYADDFAKLKAAWGNPPFGGFDEAVPMMGKDLPTSPASMGGWMDTRIFIRDQVLSFDVENARRIREALPAPQHLGIDGFGLGSTHHIPYSGVDWGSMLTGPFNTHFPYTDERLCQFAMFRGLSAPQGSPFPVQGGEKDDKKWVYYARPWQQAMAGGAGGVIGLTRFIGSTYVHEYGYIYPQTAWFVEAEKPLRHGLGKILIDSEMAYDPVLFLYSQPSLMADCAAGQWIDPENKHLLHRPGAWSLWSLQAMMNDCGVTPGWTTDDLVARGALKERRPKLLVIPDIFGLALSDATCDAIRQFVKDGGTVVAMLSPALFDEKGQLRAKGGLDDVFGVTRGSVEFGSRPSDYLVNPAKNTDPRLYLPGWLIAEFFEKGLKTAGGKALGEHIFMKDPAPAFVLNDFGKGKALLLNMLETQYYRHPYADAQKMMRAVLGMAEVTPPVTVTDAVNSFRWGYQISRHQDGANQYVGVYRLSETPGGYSDESVVKLPAKAHVYLTGGVLDAINGLMQTPAYLGETAEPKVTLKGAGSVLLAALPYKIKAFDVDIPSSARRGQDAVIKAEVKTAGAKPGRHVAHVELKDPTGLRHSVYCGNFELKDGKGEFVIPFALNDLKGDWKVTVREAVTGLAQEDEIRVK